MDLIGFIRFTLCLLRNSNQRKHVFRWLESLKKDYFVTNNQPWLVFDAIDFLIFLSLKGKKVFEYGSGGSTLFWLNHSAECVSIEHNRDWYKLMNNRLEGKNGIDYRLVQPEANADNEIFDSADPNLALSEDETFRGFNFMNYVRQIEAFPNDFFDIVLIDGRARPACIMHSVTKVKVGGMLILDNSDRNYYLSKTRRYLGNFEEKEFRGVIPAKAFWSTTTIFIKTRRS